jgi:hypothetical protein
VWATPPDPHSTSYALQTAVTDPSHRTSSLVGGCGLMGGTAVNSHCGCSPARYPGYSCTLLCGSLQAALFVGINCLLQYFMFLLCDVGEQYVGRKRFLRNGTSAALLCPAGRQHPSRCVLHSRWCQQGPQISHTRCPCCCSRST